MRKNRGANLLFEYGNPENGISISFPLTTPTGKVRVRTRNSKDEYGKQVYKDDLKDSNCYIDWQIEYDTTKRKNSESKASFFRSENKKQKKYFYSLSDFILYFYKTGAIKKQLLEDVIQDLSKKNNNDFISTHHMLTTEQKKERLSDGTVSIFNNNTIKSYSMVYPTFLISLSNSIDVEIGLFKGGLATSSLVPHLYVCIPLESLSNFNKINGRKSDQNDIGIMIINKDNIGTFVDVFHILGLLDKQHCDDVINILNEIIKKRIIRSA